MTLESPQMKTEFEIAAPLAEALDHKGYETLTPVQEAVLNPALFGRDLLVSAQTGSGKTVAFGLALAPSILQQAPRLPEAVQPSALIVAPTRELALQVTRELQWLYAPAAGRIVSCIGGVDIRDERQQLAKGAHIVVGTPGRLVDHIRRGSLDLGDIRSIVLDEADEMMDMGFREELEFVLDAAPEDRQTLMFSATVSKPIARLAATYQNNAERLNTISTASSHSDITYQAMTVIASDVEKAVINTLLYHDAPNAIVFCSRRDAVNKLAARLTNRGFSVVALSGEFSQKERSNSVLAMRDGRARVCVATDVAARGLDLPGLDLVIHADLPRNKEGLLHRSGRTGRAGRPGVCALIVPVRARRRTERLLQDANVEAEWRLPPSAADIEVALNNRLLSSEALQSLPNEAETELTNTLLEKYSAEHLAAAIVRLTRATDSAPEILQDPGAQSSSSPRKGNYDPDRGYSREPRREHGGRRGSDFQDGHWIKLGVGRKKKADPKWLIPMLCKSGGFSRNSIGAIRIEPDATLVELKPDAAARLMDAAGERQIIDKSIWISRSDAPGTEKPKSVKTKGVRKSGPKKIRRPDTEKSGAKPQKKKRIGPKKPRGPNGEKKRSQKVMKRNG
ncbi:MAG: DEAD/DEAH box helicase [Hyphomonadaceae bacterium]|nr:DEAD/DEAH box helicase [Hyphomonadaceae bacterium]